MSPPSASRRAKPRWLPRAGGAVCLSLLAHGAAAVTAGTVIKLRGSAAFATATPRIATPVSLTEIELVPAPVAPLVAPEPDDSDAALRPEIPRPATPVQRRAGGPARARAHASGPEAAAATPASEPAAPATTAPAPGDDQAPRPRFALTVGTIGNVAAVPAAPAEARGSGPSTASGASAHGAVGEAAVSEREVTVRARLVSSSPLVYPEAARRAEVEADLALEIIVDLDGQVLSARVVRPAGYGLDEEAVRAVRGYRFSPARRDGRPVRVRMPWTVQFRLR